MINENKLNEIGEQLLKESSLDETCSFIITSMDGYKHIQIGDSIAHIIKTDQQLRDLEEAIQQVRSLKFAVPFGNNPTTYKITDSGKNFAKSL